MRSPSILVAAPTRESVDELTRLARALPAVVVDDAAH